MAEITIIGSGFGALTTIRQLRKRRVTDPITVISPLAELHYLPSTIWIPSGERTRGDLTLGLGPFFERHGVRHVAASVTGLADGGRTVLTDAGEVRNDHLVIASGGRFLRKLPGIEHAIIPCDGIAAAEQVQARLASLEGGTIAIGFATNPAEQSAMRGGPMFEYLFILDEMLRRQRRRDRFRLVFFSPADRPGARLGAKAVDGLLAEMRRRGIDTHLGHKLVRFEDRRVVTEGGEIPADLILFMPGLTGPAWLAETDLPLSPGGMIVADAECRAPGRANVWVVGDVGSYPGPDWLPKQGHQADLYAKAAAENIASVLVGGQPTARFKAELICIVDALTTGMLVYRSDKLNLVLPRSRLFHWMKLAFEPLYLRAYR